MRAGALDFLTLPVDPGHLLSAVQSARALGEITRAKRERSRKLHHSLERLTLRERELVRIATSLSVPIEGK